MFDPAQPDLVEAVGWKRDGQNVVQLGKLVFLPLGALFASPLNPRKHFDPAGLDELEASIANDGLLQPLTARESTTKHPDAKGLKPVKIDGHVVPPHEVYLGGRRLRCLLRALEKGTATVDTRVPVNVRPCADLELVMLAATENLQRRDLDPLEEAETFEALRKVLPKAETDKRVEASIARRLGVSESTVFRRLALLKLTPPARTMLRKGELTLRQAKLLAMLPAAEQKSALDKPWNLDEESLSSAVGDSCIPTTDAIFDLKLYDGPLLEDAQPGQKKPRIYFGDVAQFQVLQRAAIDAKKAKLAAGGKWDFIDELEPDDHNPWRLYERGSGKKCGVVVTLRADLSGVEFHEGLRLRKAEKPNAQPPRAKPSGGTKPHEPAPTRWLTESQRVEIKTAKTIALRRALCDLDGVHVGLALAVLALMGCHPEIDLRGGQLYQACDTIFDEDHRAALERALAPLGPLVKQHALAGSRKDKAMLGEDGLDGEAAAAVFTVLVEQPAAVLQQMLAALLAVRIATWPSDRDIGDTPLMAAVAGALPAARKHLAEIWAPTAELFKAWPRDRLARLAVFAGAADDVRGAKKGEIVAICTSVSGKWPLELFPELAFAETEDLERALEGKPPKVKKPPKGDGLTAFDRAHGRPAGVE